MRLKITLKTIRHFSLALLLLVLGGGLGYFFGTRQVTLTNNKNPIKIVNRLSPKNNQVDFSLFWEVWDRLHQEYLDTDAIDDEKLVYGAIKGMTSAIGDPYTVFLSPKENLQAKSDLNGEFEGVGMQLGYIDDQLAVIAPLDGMPASKAGIKSSDLIIHIKDEKKKINVDTFDMSLQEAVSIIRGPKGTPITLTLYRKNKGDFEVSVTRDTIIVPSVELEIGKWQQEWVEDSNGDIALLRVSRFGERTFAQWNQAVTEIINQKSNLKGIVLDLRNNPGGYFQGAIDIASEFIPEGVIVQQQSKYQTETYSVQKNGKLIDIPVVILINRGSASASEILAGALRDRLNVKLVGEKSFGKGTVQDAIDLRDQAGLHVTIARWLLPNGSWIHKEGLKPDISVEIKPVDEVDNQSNSENEQEIKPVDTQLKEAINQL